MFRLQSANPKKGKPKRKASKWNPTGVKTKRPKQIFRPQAEYLKMAYKKWREFAGGKAACHSVTVGKASGENKKGKCGEANNIYGRSF